MTTNLVHFDEVEFSSLLKKLYKFIILIISILFSSGAPSPKRIKREIRVVRNIDSRSMC